VLRNEPAFIEALTCIRCLEAQRVLIPWHLATAEIRDILVAVSPAAVIVHRDLLARVVDAATGHPAPQIIVVDTPAELRRVYELPADGPWPARPGLVRWEELIGASPAGLPIPPGSIEALILQHPQVLDCAVFAVPDEEFGQVIGCAVEVADADMDVDRELRAYLAPRLSEHKIPVVIGGAQQPLRRSTGKVDRSGLSVPA
jgi:acyl-CoA synthetase (AMP-forming)/AMP-acid ligase II